MADTQKARISFSLVDTMGTRASVALYALLDPTKTIGDLAQAVEDLRLLIKAFSGAAVVLGTAVIEDATGAADAPATSQFVEANSLFNYLVPASGRSHGIAVPAVRSAFIVGGHVDQTAGAVTDLDAKLTGNISSSVGPVVVGKMVSSDFLDLGALADIRLAFRKHRRQVTRESFELPA